MDTNDSALPEPAPRHLNTAERSFWEKAFLAAELPSLMTGELKDTSPQGAAHIAADYADAALIEMRRRVAP